MALQSSRRLSRVTDRRRLSRLLRLAGALDEKPDASYPDATVTDAGLEGADRLLNNGGVSADGILAGHYEETAKRVAQEEWALAVHLRVLRRKAADEAGASARQRARVSSGIFH